jgi:hypothetical protein
MLIKLCPWQTKTTFIKLAPATRFKDKKRKVEVLFYVFMVVS